MHCIIGVACVAQHRTTTTTDAIVHVYHAFRCWWRPQRWPGVSTHPRTWWSSRWGRWRCCQRRFCPFLCRFLASLDRALLVCDGCWHAGLAEHHTLCAVLHLAHPHHASSLFIPKCIGVHTHTQMPVYSAWLITRKSTYKTYEQPSSPKRTRIKTTTQHNTAGHRVLRRAHPRVRRLPHHRRATDDGPRGAPAVRQARGGRHHGAVFGRFLCFFMVLFWGACSRN